MAKLFPKKTYVIGGGSTGTNQHAITFERTLESYSVGGHVIDLAMFYSTINFVGLSLKHGTRGTLPCTDWHIILNSPAAGKATLKIMRKRFEDANVNTTSPSGQPAGVTIRAVSGQTTSSESSHTHTINHDHGSFTSGVNTFGGGQVLLDAVGPNLEQHTHTLDIPNFTGASAAGTSHNHQDNIIYQHGHAASHTATNFTWSELPNTTFGPTFPTFYVLVAGVSL